MSIHYDPKENLSVQNLLSTNEYSHLIQIIDKSNVTETQKEFLRLAATRFIRFNYAKIADYYCSTDDTMKDLIEELHLVVVDRDSAIEKGYFEYFDNYSKLIEGLVSE